MDQIPLAESDLEEYSPIARNSIYTQECSDDLPEFSPLDGFSCLQVVSSTNQEIDLCAEAPPDCFDAANSQDAEPVLQAEPPLDPVQSQLLDVRSKSQELASRLFAKRVELKTVQSAVQVLIPILVKLRREKTNAELELVRMTQSVKKQADPVSCELTPVQANCQLLEQRNTAQGIQTETTLMKVQETASKAVTLAVDLLQDFLRIKELNERVERIESRVRKVLGAGAFTWMQIRRKHVCRVILFLIGVALGYAVKTLWRSFRR